MLFAALILAAAAFAIWSLAPQTIGETARRKFLHELQKHYVGHTVSIRRGHFDPDVGLTFEDIRIGESSTSMLNFGARELIRIDRLTVVADVHPEKLLDQANPLVTRRIAIDGVTANVWLQEDGKICLEALMPLPNLGPAAPRIDLADVHLRLFGDDPAARPIDAELNRVVLLNRPRANGTCDDGTCDVDVTVHAAAEFAEDVKLKVITVGDALDVRLAATGLHFSRRLYDRLPVQWCDLLRNCKDLTAIGDTTLSYHRDADGNVDYESRTTVHDGRFTHPSLPGALTQLRGVIVCDPDGVSIDASQATFGDAIATVTGRIDGHQWPCDAALDVRTRGLMLDDRLAASLPAAVQDQWERLQPIGRVDITASLVHQAGQWKAAADVDCKGVDVRFEKFPYPVEQVVGAIKLRDDIVMADSLSGRIGGNRMQCAFRIPTKPGITNEKTFVVATDGPIPIDNTLLNSLSPRGEPTSGLETFVRSLRPRGSIRLSMGVFATDADGRQTRKLDLQVIDGHLRYEKFAYPLYNVSGMIKVENDLVELKGFRGTNANAGVILCDGAYRMPGKQTPPAAYQITDAGIVSASQSIDQTSQLALNFHAINVPLDESLRSSLPYSTQQVWEAISPSGVLDELLVTIGKRGDDPLTMNLTAKQNEHGQVTNRILSMRPSSLPYRVDITGGVVRFDGTTVRIESLRGRHDASKLSAEGVCVENAEGRWVLSVNLHSGSRVNPDAELIAALPMQMREAMRRLQLRGPVNVRGKTVLTLPTETDPEPIIDWDLELQLEGNRIADVGPVHSLRGEISVQGRRDANVLLASGDVRIDSMHVDNLQITGIRGPFSINEDRLLLGKQATSGDFRSNATVPVTLPPQPSIRGNLFGGTIDLDGEVILSSAAFDVGVAVENARVPTLLADFGYGNNDLTGTLTGETQLQGNLGTTDLLKGGGSAKISGANLYQLPFIVQVMNLVRVTPGEDVAFTDGEIEFTLFGDTITFNDMQLWGDLISLQGGGTMNRRQELDLSFNTRVSPQNTFTKLIRPLGSGRYTLMTIDVRGPINDVQIERRALDGVGQTLERLFPGRSTEPTSGEPEAKSAGVFQGWLRK